MKIDIEKDLNRLKGIIRKELRSGTVDEDKIISVIDTDVTEMMDNIADNIFTELVKYIRLEIAKAARTNVKE